MTSDDEAPVAAPALPQRSYVLFTAKVAREVCRRMAAGETQAEICADPAMPSPATLWRWSRKRAGFARAFARARALGARAANGKVAGFCPVAANEIVARVSEGEMLTMICADPHLPSVRTVVRWRLANAEFAEELRQAREGLAERFSDLGWRMAMAATPETAYLTRVRLGQLRWTASVLGPRTHGKLKPTALPEPPRMTTIRIRHFQIEAHPETGQHRVVGYSPDPDTGLSVRTSEGPWKDPVEKIMAAHAEHEAQRRLAREAAAGAAPEDPDDPEGWC